MTTGERLKLAIAKKYKDERRQGDIAEALGVPPGTLSEWLNNKYEPSLESLRNVAKRLGVTAASLIGDGRARKAKAS